MGILARFPATSGDYASCPDATDISGLTDLSAVALLSLDDWTPTGNQTIISHLSTTSNQRSWRLYVTATDGKLNFDLSTDGINPQTATSSAAPSFTDATMYWVLVTRKSSNGEVKFYTASYSSGTFTPPTLANFTQLGTTRTSGTGTLYNSTADLIVGGITAGTAALLKGDVRRARLYSGLYGSGSETLLRDFYPTDAGSTSATSWTATATSTGETWTLNGGDVLLVGDTKTGGATLAGSGAVSATGTKFSVKSGSATVAGSGAVAATGSKFSVKSGSATVAGAGAIVATGLRTTFGSATLAGSGSISGSGLRTTFGQATIAGAGDISTVGLRTATRGATILAVGDIATTGNRTTFSIAAIIGEGVISAAGEGPTPPVPTTTAVIGGVGGHRLWQKSRSITLT